MATSLLQQPSAMEELFPGLAAALAAHDQHQGLWQQRDGRLFNTKTQNHLHPGSQKPDQAHEAELVASWLQHPDCLQSADTGLLLHVLHHEAQEFRSSGFDNLSDLNLAAIHDSGQDYQTQWAAQELLRHLESEQLELAASISQHDGGLLLIYGIGHGQLLAECLVRLQPRLMIIFEPDLELLRLRLTPEDCEQLLEAIGDSNIEIILVTDAETDLAYLKAKAAIESVNLFSQEKLFRLQSRQIELFKELDHRFGNGDSMLRTLRYQGFFTDELHMMLNASITFTQAPPRTISHGQLPAHGRHAVICASGPSLDAQLTLLQQYREQFDLFSCFSTIGTLLQAGLQPDYHCNQERHSCHIPLLMVPSIANYVGRALLLCSANNDPRMNRLYADVAAFFRSGSCASALLAPSLQDCISGEGPQVANLALQFAVLLGYRTIHLFGVDLGSADPEQPRSAGAISQSPRVLDRPVPGNRRERVWADQGLIECAEYMSWLINGSVLPGAQPLPNLIVYNYSDGQRIDGTVPSAVEAFAQQLGPLQGPQPAELLRALPCYDSQLARARFIGFDWLQKLREYLAVVRALIASPLCTLAHERFLKLSDRQFSDLPDQVLPRMLAGTLGRVWYLVLLVDARLPALTPQQRQQWQCRTSEILNTCLDSMERLTLELVAYVEALETVENHQLRSVLFS